MRIARVVGIGLLAWTALFGAGAQTAAKEQTESNLAVAERTFSDRIEQYAQLRVRLEEPLPAPDARRDAWSRLLTRQYLASAIRAALARTTQDPVFAPPVDGFFREAIARAVYDVDIEGLVEAGEEEPLDLIDGEPVPLGAVRDVPDALLARLPSLPGGISYRIVGDALILWDEHARILIDALRDAFVAR